MARGIFLLCKEMKIHLQSVNAFAIIQIKENGISHKPTPFELQQIKCWLLPLCDSKRFCSRLNRFRQLLQPMG